MVLALSPQHKAAMSAHAERVYPEECCGLMVGSMTSEGDEPLKSVVELVPLDNEWTETALTETALTETALPEAAQPTKHTKHRRYYINPQDMLRVQKQARSQGLNIIGIYHSHPDHVAEPSECDRALAWPEYAYVIVSVRSGKAVDIKNWALDSDHQFRSEAIKVTPSAATDRMPVSA